MGARASSPVVGREAELARMLAALSDVADDDTTRWVVVTGEAGIGKSSLVDELTRRYEEALPPEDHGLVLVGRCVDLGAAGAPFTSIKGILRSAVRQRGVDAVRAAAGPDVRVVAALLPELGDAVPADPGALRDAVADLFVQWYRRRRLVVVLEDVQWADASTVALLRWLVRNLTNPWVTVVLTCRTEDVARADPVRELLADAARRRGAVRVDLGRLAPDDVARQLEALLGREPTAELLASVVERSQGVPLFVEELAVLGDAPLPESLRDVLLTRYAGTSSATQEVLRLLAVGGERGDHEVVAAVFEGPPAALDAAVREAVEAHVLARDSERYVFRHALLREAVLGELVPGEARRLHVRFAEALAAGAGARESAAEIAHHWADAREPGRAFAAYLAAADAARAAGGPAAAADLLERALALRPRGRDAADGADVVDVLVRLADAREHAEDPVAAVAALDAALAALADPDPGAAAVPGADAAARALAWRRVGLQLRRVGLLFAASRPDASDAAVALLADLPVPQTDDELSVHAAVLSGFAFARFEVGRYADALALAQQAADEAVAARGEAGAVQELTYLAAGLAFAGRHDDSDRTFARVEPYATEPGAAGLWASLRAGVLGCAGCWEEQLVVARAGIARLGDDAPGATPAARRWVPFLRMSAVDALTALGRWTEAANELDVGLGARPSAPGRRDFAVRAVRAAVVRGDLAGADAARRRLGALADEGTVPDLRLAHLTASVLAEHALASGDPAAAWERLAGLVEDAPPYPPHDMAAFAVAAAALAALRRAGRAPEPDPGDRLLAALSSCDAWPPAADWRAIVEAHLGDGGSPAGGGEGAVARWRRAAEAAARGRVPVDVALEVRVRLAEVEAHAGGRAAAQELLESVVWDARRLGAGLALREADAVARRLRPDRRPDDGDRLAALTAREREVLALVAGGLSNGQIGKRLYISTKTASVHVSAILRKLGVATRTEAAVVAVGAGAGEAHQ